MITKKILELLKNREFINIGSCDFENRPNVAPKFLLKAEEKYIYLIDFVFGRTFENLKINPRASLSVMDTDSLRGYQVNGGVEIIVKGQLYDKILSEVRSREMNLATERIIKGVQSGQGHKNFELAFPEKIAIFKVKIKEVVEIDSSGGLRRETV